jgi:arsenate reductase
MNKTSVLFLCTGNSCRSQMAEGWLRFLKSQQFDSYSAGIEAQGLNPYAVKVMAEVGVDISQQTSKLLSAIEQPTDIVISVCEHADQHCPVLDSHTQKLHVGFDDPPKLALETASEQQALDCYRRVRDDIKVFIESIEQTLSERG